MKNTKSIYAVVAIVLFSVLTGNNIANAQRLKPGPQDLSFFSKADETDQPYAIYIPQNFDESKKYPLVVFLHGAWSNHRLGLRRVFGQGNLPVTDLNKPDNVQRDSDLEASRYFPRLKDTDYIVAAPYARGTAGYQGIPEEDVYEMLDDIKSRFLIDEDRVYLTGLSMGGGGTIWLGLSRPDIWAAIAPCCPASPDGSAEIACNAFNLPVHLFVGDEDFLYKSVLEWKTKFETHTSRFDYAEYPGVGHNSWDYAYKDGFIFEWFSQFKRDMFPEELKFATRWFKYNKAYWIKLDNFTPGTLTTVNARFTGANAIEIQTDNLEAFSLNLAGHPLFNPSKRLAVRIDGKAFNVSTGDGVSFMKVNGNWTNRKFIPQLTSKRQGAEGPLSTAVSSNHIYVYGTGGNPSQEELAARRALAASAADWSGMGGRIMVFPRVLSDKELRESDFDNCNIILFGTRENNLLIEKLADRLPFHLNDDVKDHGLVYVFPLNNRYVLVNSGLPWWTSPGKGLGQGGMAFMGSKIDMLKNFKDFILFKDSPANIISEGYFDNNWKLPADAGSAMKNSGVIRVK